MKKFIPQPTKGLLVVSTYRLNEKSGSYAVYDLERNEFAIPKQTIQDVVTSDNVISFLGIVEALKYSYERGEFLNVFCANNCAVAWTKKKTCNSKITHHHMLEITNEALNFLFQNSFNEEIVGWQPSWPSPRIIVGEAFYHEQSN